jgi:hypothetical protein
VKRIKLNLDDLRVESFSTAPRAFGAEGTVFGQTAPTYDTCIGATGCDMSCVQACIDTIVNCTAVACSGACDTDVDCGSGICHTASCPDPTNIHPTCDCADMSEPSWASCGTTCMNDATCQPCPASVYMTECVTGCLECNCGS